jgi:hypothetical protein
VAIYALMGANYAWATPDALWEMPVDLIGSYLSELLQIEFRRALPMAQFEATVGNMMGGKGGDGDKPLASDKVIHPFERLPAYARPPEVNQIVTWGGLIYTPEQCRAIVWAFEDGALPNWVSDIINRLQNLRRMVYAVEREEGGI